MQLNGQHDTDKAVASPADAQHPSLHDADVQMLTYHETNVPYVIPNK